MSGYETTEFQLKTTGLNFSHLHLEMFLLQDPLQSPFRNFRNISAMIPGPFLVPVPKFIEPNGSWDANLYTVPDTLGKFELIFFFRYISHESTRADENL